MLQPGLDRRNLDTKADAEVNSQSGSESEVVGDVLITIEVASSRVGKAMAAARDLLVRLQLVALRQHSAAKS